MTEPRIFKMPFAKIYPLYQAKLHKKQRTTAELNQIITWLTGMTDVQLQQALTDQITCQDFFDHAPQLNPKRQLITGVICGVRVETISDPTMQAIRYLDKLVDELAHGKTMAQVLRH